jgi:hypothetical protein
MISRNDVGGYQLCRESYEHGGNTVLRKSWYHATPLHGVTAQKTITHQVWLSNSNTWFNESYQNTKALRIWNCSQAPTINTSVFISLGVKVINNMWTRFKNFLPFPLPMSPGFTRHHKYRLHSIVKLTAVFPPNSVHFRVNHAFMTRGTWSRILPWLLLLCLPLFP